MYDLKQNKGFFLIKTNCRLKEVAETTVASSNLASERASSHVEDLIVTPFAQILASLRSVRNNLYNLTNVQSSKWVWMQHIPWVTLKSKLFDPNRPRRSQPSTSQQREAQRNVAPGDDGYIRLAMDTVDELDWCLDQLETVQTHRSVSDMASLKVSWLLAARAWTLTDSN